MGQDQAKIVEVTVSIIALLIMTAVLVLTSVDSSFQGQRHSTNKTLPEVVSSTHDGTSKTYYRSVEE